MEQLEDSNEAVSLLNKALEAEDWQLCREVLRFLRSIDDSGSTLREVLTHTGLFSAGDPGRLTLDNGNEDASD